MQCCNNNIIMKEVMNDCKEKYVKVKKLLDEDSKSVLPSEPYMYKYRAKSILIDMRKAIENILSEKSTTEFPEVVKNGMLGAVLLHIGVIDMETEELTNSEKLLVEAESILVKYSLEIEVILILLNVYNNLGILLSNRDKPDIAKSYLVKAKDLYENFKCTAQFPVTVDRLFGITEKSNFDELQMLEKIYTLTLYYLAQVYGSLKCEMKSAMYCHITLKRQYQYCDFDHIDWALNSATLSQFFAAKNGFLQSRHHLAAASWMLKKYEAKLQLMCDEGEIYQAKLETFRHRSADVAICWAKYCIMLMSSSKDRLMNDEQEELCSAVTDLSNLTIEENEHVLYDDINDLSFYNIDVSDLEKRVSDKFLLTYGDAREVFLYCQNQLNKAKEYYALDSLASDYIKIIQDNSKALSYLAFFEEDDERRAKMHKKRINIIEDLLKEINPTYYMQYCRQLWYELGEIYTDILNIKLEKINKSIERPTPHALQKVNMLCDKSVENYEQFLKSLTDPKSGNIPDKLDEDVIRPVVNAYVIIGRNNMKKIILDKNQQLINVTKSYESYKRAVEICDKDEKAAAIMSEAYGLCKEMLQILTLKINMLTVVC